MSIVDKKAALETLRQFNDLIVQMPEVYDFYGPGSELGQYFPEGYPDHFPPINPKDFYAHDRYEDKSVTTEALPPEAYAQRDAALDSLEPRRDFPSALTRAEQDELIELSKYLKSLIT